MATCFGKSNRCVETYSGCLLAIGEIELHLIFLKVCLFIDFIINCHTFSQYEAFRLALIKRKMQSINN